MRKKGLIERIVMKDPAQNDFSPQAFPENRLKLFSYMIKNKPMKIYSNHWLTVLFFAPLIIWGVLTMEYTDWLFGLDAQEGIKHLLEHWITVYVTAIPMWVIAFVGLSGGLNVIRKLAWSDPVIIKSDFLQGIKSSGKQMALIGFLWGSAYALIRYAIGWLGFYYRVFDDSYSVVFGIFVCLFLLVVAIGFTVYMVCMSSIYNVNFKQLVVGAFKLYFADFFLATGVNLVCLLPFFVLMLAGRAFVVLFIYLLLVCFLIGVEIIPPFLVCQHTFDRIINKKDYPSYYGRGLSYGVYSDKESDITELEDSDLSEETGEENSTDAIENDFERVSDDED